MTLERDKTLPRAGTLEDLAETWHTLLGLGQAAQMLNSRSSTAVHIPITILGGFLGAGKTTLLNNLLSGEHGLRIAALVNDFGAVNIDAALVKHRAENVIELSNGCVCCSIAGGLTEAIDSLVHSKTPPDAIVLEASGVADPASVAHTCLFNDGLTLNSVITLVDAPQILAQAAHPDLSALVERQITAADLVLLNKTDLLSKDRLRDIKAELEKRFTSAHFVPVKNANIPAEFMLDARAPMSSFGKFQSGSPISEATFCTGVLHLDAPIDADRLRNFLAIAPDGLLRAKGFLPLAKQTTGIFQLVGQRWSLRPAQPDLLPAEPVLVAIGLRGRFDLAGFDRGLRACEVGSRDMPDG
ncbi:GTPase, G3E family [Roseovarius litoreus]|uniref:GTPase, G3E family n=1 Tax=Roseovarius litoreus TaxID=1155722 RepID=A0A1M7LLT1_9RHOB|nr:CobW family GTP-binding protein [Roseovarius litoreus]SHM79105.1 GTPase, G3E family [Roseovarius litoreus]